MAVHPVETYLKELSEIRRTGGGVFGVACALDANYYDG